MPAGFPGGTAMRNSLEAKLAGPAAAPASTTRFMVAVLAEAKTSAGAPSRIWSRSEELEAKLRVTLVSGWVASYAAATAAKASVKDPAAKMRSSPSAALPDPHDAPSNVMTSSATRGRRRMVLPFCRVVSMRLRRSPGWQRSM